MCLRPPSLSVLFVQLGLHGDELGVLRFIRQHRPLPAETDLLKAPFWTPRQAALLWRLQRRGSHWAQVLAQLDAALRGQPVYPRKEEA